MHSSRSFHMSIEAWVRRVAAATALLALILGVACAWAAGEAAGPAAGEGALLLGENLLRLHVVAHSDAPRDQEVKLKVRDALLSEIADGGPFKSPSEAEAWVKGNEERLVQAARKALSREGIDLPVRVETGEFYFPEKRTGALTLPAGEYRAVKVVIGDGAGRNWWCVLFPPLCFVEEEEEPAPPEVAQGGPLPALFAAEVPGLVSTGPDGARVGRAPVGGEAEPILGAGPEPELDREPEGAGREAGEGGATLGVRWRLRLWEKLSQTAYAARLREMMELARQTLRDEAL